MSLDPHVELWKAEVDRVLKRHYFIDLDEAGASEDDVLRYFGWGDPPELFVAWFAEKYDLDRRDSYFPTPVPRP